MIFAIEKNFFLKNFIEKIKFSIPLICFTVTDTLEIKKFIWLGFNRYFLFVFDKEKSHPIWRRYFEKGSNIR